MNNDFKFWNRMTGWSVFFIATISYWLTMEPTTSLWDCSEFIATSYKLEVGHPPGAPLFMMMARIASMLAPTPESVPLMINGMNALASGFCILFMFWTITHLARRIMQREGEIISRDKMLLILGAGVVGALSYAYTDTFWFSAVEGEVYALSSMFTALVVWLMLKWEENADSPTSMRWIILIAYLMGLSIGVHILNLLTIPALVMIYFFRRYSADTAKHYAWKIIAALVVSMLILGVINGIIIPYTVALGAAFDVFAVNSLGLPVNVGMMIFVVLVFAILGWLILFSHNRGLRVVNSVALCLAVVLLGFSSYAMVTIRANANPPMNSNNPSNPQMLLSMLNRDQYGNRPLLWGPYYSAKPLPLVTSGDYSEQVDEFGNRVVNFYEPTGDFVAKDVEWYNPNTGKYETRTIFDNFEYPSSANHLFPRMWFDGRKALYAQYIGNPVKVSDSAVGEWIEPSAGDDIAYFMNYQMGDMFWRYFLWNFVGRQDDEQLTRSGGVDGVALHGGWSSGIGFIDRIFNGPQDSLPSEMAHNEGHNSYFFLPLLLGLLGLLYQLNRDWRNFLVVTLLFVMMGVALVVYFNTAPGEPRERDYVYAGAFYAFSIWLGLGVLAIGDVFKWLAERLAKFKNVAMTSAIAALVVSASVPLVLATENWDDHDRSGRYFARDIGLNFLNTAPENAIIINYGDNDTFPLWYCQEVEGVRPDVRVMNSSYLGGEWYIDEMKLAANDASGVPFTIPAEKYSYVNDQVMVYPVSELITLDDDIVDMRVVNEYNRIYDELKLYEQRYNEAIEANNDAAADNFANLYNANYHKLSALGDAYGRSVNALADLDNYNLPLKDVVELFISDSPFEVYAEYLSPDEQAEMDDADYYEWYPTRRMRLLSKADAAAMQDMLLAEGYRHIGTISAKADSQITGEASDYIVRTNRVYIDVDRDAAIAANIISADEVCDERVYVDIKHIIDGDKVYDRLAMTRDHILMLDLLAHFDWKRPISFTQLHIMESYGLANIYGVSIERYSYARFDGYSYTLVPHKTTREESATCYYMNIDELYPLYIGEEVEGDIRKPLRFGNLADEDVYVDYFIRYNLSSTATSRHFARIAQEFISRGEEGDLLKAEKLLDRGLEVLPMRKVGSSACEMLGYINCYYDICDNIDDAEHSEALRQKALAYAAEYISVRGEWVRYYASFIDEGIFSEYIAKHFGFALLDVFDAADILLRNEDFQNLENLDEFDDIVRSYVVAIDKFSTPAIMDEVRKYYTEDEFVPSADAICVIYNLRNLYDLYDILPHERKAGYASYYKRLVSYLERCGYIEGSEVEGSAASGSSGVKVEYSDAVQQIYNSYYDGVKSLDKSSQGLKQAVGMLSERLSVAANVKYEDPFQYFYDLSSYAEQLRRMASQKGINCADVDKLLLQSDELYTTSEEQLKDGDNKAINYIALCAETANSLLDKAASGKPLSAEDNDKLYLVMSEIIDVLSISQSMAGSFEWVANPIAGAQSVKNQASFDDVVVRYLAYVEGMLPAPVASDSQSVIHLDILAQIYSIIPSTRFTPQGDVDASYIVKLRDFISREDIYNMILSIYEK